MCFFTVWIFLPDRGYTFQNGHNFTGFSIKENKDFNHILLPCSLVDINADAIKFKAITHFLFNLRFACAFRLFMQ
ncbi:hypothetical protein HMPREF3089_05745 [Klebsiella sp. HMSC22F09]|nr:hypothetical protein HMPREF3089_05745 [Klebsiella sp. HMSC22F09]